MSFTGTNPLFDNKRVNFLPANYFPLSIQMGNQYSSVYLSRVKPGFVQHYPDGSSAQIESCRVYFHFKQEAQLKKL